MLLAATLFFISIVSYGFLNAWMWDRARRAFPVLDRQVPSVAGLAAVLILTASPIATRILDANGFQALACVLAVVGDPWTAIAFWFCVVALPLDIWDHVLRVAFRRSPGAQRLALGTRGQFLSALSITAALTVWGFLEAGCVRTTQIRIETTKLPSSCGPVTVAQISDLHIGLGESHAPVRRAAALISERKPDLIVATGDVFDGGDPSRRDLSALAALHAPLGKFAVLGNHEYYTGPDACIAALEKAGFRVLVDEVVVLSIGDAPCITLVGDDDPARRHMTLMANTRAERKPLPRPEEGTFVLQLRHRPDVGSRTEDPFDLQLSGHTHAGQIWPFRYLVLLAHRYIAGTYELDAGRRLHVSRGLGTWGPPLRFLAPPEVTFIVLEPKNRFPADKTRD